MKPATDNDDVFNQKVNEKATRILKAQRENKRSAWSGFGLFGIVGWSIVVPALAGAAAGDWLDKTFRQTFSWTLSLLMAGLLIGCVIAWNWINKENKDMHQKNKNTNE